MNIEKVKADYESQLHVQKSKLDREVQTLSDGNRLLKERIHRMEEDHVKITSERLVINYVLTL